MSFNNIFERMGMDCLFSATDATKLRASDISFFSTVILVLGNMYRIYGFMESDLHESPWISVHGCPCTDIHACTSKHGHPSVNIHAWILMYGHPCMDIHPWIPMCGYPYMKSHARRVIH